MATAILHHHQVVGHNATTRGPSTTCGALSTQIEVEGRHQAHPQRHAEYPPLPPSLLSTKIIQLPALADVPIYVNPLFSYGSFKATLEYDLRLPPITANLPPTAKAHASHRDWRQQPAMNSSMVGTMTIVVPGLERVVVFPATLDSAVVTVGDLLVAVYRAMQESAFEHRGGLNERDVWVLPPKAFRVYIDTYLGLQEKC